MTDPEQILEKIIISLAAIQNKSTLDLTKDDNFKLPRIIPAGDSGHSIQITKEIDHLIALFAECLKERRNSLGRTVKKSEWCNLVRTTIGSHIAIVDLSRPTRTIASELLPKIEKDIDEFTLALCDREFSFGTSLFSNTDVAPFAIGPVNFESREHWLDRQVLQGNVTPVTQRRIKRHWTGKRLKPRKHNWNQIQETDILDMVGNAPYVCSIRLPFAFAYEAGLETALTCARLAITCISLTFSKPSNAISGFNLRYDGPPHLQTALCYIPKRKTFAGQKKTRHLGGPHISPANWKSILTQFEPVLSAAGRVLENLMDPDRASPQSALLESLLQSLIWFEKGCREPGDQIAILFFAASLDALGKGTKANGILSVLEARLGIKRSDPIYDGGPSLKDAINKIYSDGRSRTVHGTSDKIGFDWISTRHLAETLAAYALVACLDFAENMPSALTSDDFKTP